MNKQIDAIDTRRSPSSAHLHFLLPASGLPVKIPIQKMFTTHPDVETVTSLTDSN